MLADTAFTTPEQFEKPLQSSVLAVANNYHFMFFFCFKAWHVVILSFSYGGIDVWKLNLNKHLQQEMGEFYETEIYQLVVFTRSSDPNDLSQRPINKNLH